FDAAEALEQPAKPFTRHAEHLEVDVALLRLGQIEQPVANPAADDERPAAGVADRGGEGERQRSRVHPRLGSGVTICLSTAFVRTAARSGPSCQARSR